MAKQAKAALALFTAPTSKGKKGSEKASRKEPAKKSTEKEKDLEKTRPPLQKRLPKQERSRCAQDVSVLRKLVVFGCQVRVEHDSPGTDGG